MTQSKNERQSRTEGRTNITKLTPKQDKFANVYVETSNASEAYRQAYAVSPDTKEQTIWKNAYTVLENTKVATRVLELQERAAERTMVTVETLTEEFKQNRTRADELDQVAAMNSATSGVAKLHGLGSENSKVELGFSSELRQLMERASKNTKRLGE